MSVQDHQGVTFEPGAVAVANLLERNGMKPTAEQAKELWVECKAFFDALNYDDGEVVQEILESETGDLDTLIRDDLRLAMAKTLTGLQWPCNMDSQEVTERFLDAFAKALVERGIKSDEQV